MPVKNLSTNGTRETVAQPLSPKNQDPPPGEAGQCLYIGSRGTEHSALVVARATNSLVRLHCITSPGPFPAGFF